MPKPKQAAKPDLERIPDDKTEAEYLKDIEKCERTIMKASFDTLKNTYDRYMALVKLVEDTLGWKGVDRLGLMPEKISEMCLSIIHSNILDAGLNEALSAREMIVRALNVTILVSNENHDKVEAEFIQAQDPSLGLLYDKELENLRESKKLNGTELEDQENEMMALRYKVQELKKAIFRIKDRQWYKTLRDEEGPGTQQPPATSTPAGSAKESPKKDRATICRKIITEAQRKIIKHLLAKHNDVHDEFKEFSEIVESVSRGEIYDFLTAERDAFLSVALHGRYNNMPKDIADEKLAEVIEDMTKGVKELIIDHDNLHQAYEKYERKLIETNQLGGITRNQHEQMLKNVRACKAGKDADFKIFDARIEAEKATIDRFTKEMQVDWDAKKADQLRKDSKIQREKLIEKMVKIQQEKCVATMCRCIERERKDNLLAPGSGTLKRYIADRRKVEEILSGAEPWKTFRKDMEDVKEKIFQAKDDLDDLEKEMGGVGLD